MAIQFITLAWPISNSSEIQLWRLFENNSKIPKFQSDLLAKHARKIFPAAMILFHRYQIKIDYQFSGRQLVVGPAFSREAHFLTALAVKVNSHLISYSLTNPTLADQNSYSTFYRTTSSDSILALT